MKSDKGQLLEIIELNIPKYFAPEEKEDFETYLENKIDEYFVLTLNDKIVGSGGINYTESLTTAKISWDMIHSAYHNKGLGRLLLKHRLEHIKTQNKVKRIVVRTSQMANGFYQKQGFELKEIIKDYWSKGYDLYLMEYPV